MITLIQAPASEQPIDPNVVKIDHRSDPKVLEALSLAVLRGPVKVRISNPVDATFREIMAVDVLRTADESCPYIWGPGWQLKTTPVSNDTPPEVKPPTYKPGTIGHNFSYHAPTGGKASKHEQARNIIREAALLLADLVPPGRELSLAQTKLEEAMMWANAGIARNPEKV